MRNVHSELTTVVTMRATTGYIQSISRDQQFSMDLCARSRTRFRDGHIQAGEE